MLVLCSLCLCGFLTAGCGVQGAPQPPLLAIPQPAEIHGVQRGGHVYLDWAMPRLTSEGQAIQPQKLGEAQVYRAILPGLQAQITRQEFEAKAQKVASVPVEELRKPAVEYSEALPAGQAGNTAAYAVMLKNQRGASAGYSNIITIPILAAPAAPPALHVQSAEQAIVLDWPAVAGADAYHVYRCQDNGALEFKAQTPAQPNPGYDDPDFKFGNEYRYVVRAVTVRGAFAAESADSPPVTVKPVDTFPPKAPAGLVAVPGTAGVELSWEPGAEADLAGYNIYRSDNGAAPRKLNKELLVSSAYRDGGARPGVTYSYSVSAVDQAGNESAHSEPVTIKP